MDERKGAPWSSSACPPSAPTWRRARWSSGWSSPATGSSAAMSSPWSRRRRAPSKSRSSRPARSSRSWSISATRCRSARRSRESTAEGEAKPACGRGAAGACSAAPAAATRRSASRGTRKPAPRPLRCRQAPAAAAARLRPPRAGLRSRAAIDLATITGSGPDGAIVHADVERSLGAAAAPAEREARRRPRSRCHAHGDCRRHGAVEAGNPALLSRASSRRHGSRAMAGAHQRNAAARQAAC